MPCDAIGDWYDSGQIIATSAEVIPKCALVRESPKMSLIQV